MRILIAAIFYFAHLQNFAATFPTSKHSQQSLRIQLRLEIYLAKLRLFDLYQESEQVGKRSEKYIKRIRKLQHVSMTKNNRLRTFKNHHRKKNRYWKSFCFLLNENVIKAGSGWKKKSKIFNDWTSCWFLKDFEI